MGVYIKGVGKEELIEILRYENIFDVIDVSEFIEIKDEPQMDCLTCRYNNDEWDSPKCDRCSKANSNYEPQTERGDK